GANPLVSNGSAMSAPDFRRRLKQLHQRGGQSILLDPRRTESAAHVSEHRFIRPGTDALLLLAMLQVIHAEGLARPGRLADFCDGFDRLDQLGQDWPPERVSAATGIASEAIRELARRFAGAPTAVCYGRMGTCTQAFGSLSSWLINVLNIITGNFDRPGGAMFARPAVDMVRAATLSGQKGSFGRWHSRVRGLPEFGGELPAATLSDEIEAPGSGQIKALITLAGNPVLSAPNGRRLESLLPGLDFMLAIDIFCNETTRHADLILPPVSPLERSHFDLLYPLMAVDNFARFAPPLYVPPVSARHDWQILLALSTRLEAHRSLPKACFAQLRAGLLERIGPEGMIDLMLRTGPYPGLCLSKLKAAPDGLALGPLSPCLPGRLHTPRRRIRLVPERFAADLDRLAAWLAQPLPEFVLIGRRQLRSNNSWLHNSPRLVKGPDPCTLLMHPDDAGRLGLKPGDHVCLGSRAGEIEAPLELSASMMPGVVSLPHGWGHHRPGLGLTVAAAHAGVSANDLTDELWLDQLSGTAAFNGL
ncbi:MAG TPA: molybdopterin oxidoreductase family protein, partial [Candidatus Obscuribacterales bacterium]